MGNWDLQIFFYLNGKNNILVQGKEKCFVFKSPDLAALYVQAFIEKDEFSIENNYGIQCDYFVEIEMTAKESLMSYSDYETVGGVKDAINKGSVDSYGFTNDHIEFFKAIGIRCTDD